MGKDFLDARQKLRVLNSNVAGNKIVDDFRAKVEKRLKSVLKAKQIKRLRQISIQRHGASYFGSWDARMKLKVTAEQRAQLKKLFAKRNSKSNES